MAASPADPRTPARRIADDLRNLIDQGQLGPGDQLPKTREIMARYGVSSATANAAVTQLKASGLVTSRRGAGTFVRERHLVRRDLIAGIQREYELAMSGHDSGEGIFEQATGRDDVSVDISYERGANPAAACALQVATDTELLCRTYRYALRSEPYQRFSSCLPVDLVDGTVIEDPNQERPGRGTIAQLLDLGVTVSRCDLDVEVRMPSIEEARDLAIPTGTPVFIHHRVLYAGSRPVEAGTAVVRSDLTAYTFRIDLGGAQ